MRSAYPLLKRQKPETNHDHSYRPNSMKPKQQLRKYRRLEIIGRSRRSEIWLGDDEGHLVQKEVGLLKSSLLPGHYVVAFELGGKCYPIHLEQDIRLTQDQIEKGRTVERPIPTVLGIE